MIKNIVFDIGGVLADFRIFEFLGEKGFDKAMAKRILRATAMSPYWGAFERGEISEEEAIDGFVATDPGIENEIRTAFGSLEGMLTLKESTIPLIKALKAAGCGVYYLSNYSKKAYDECAESVSFMPYTDGGIVSFKVGMTKPDPAMFHLFLERFGLTAAECVFVDDTEENVTAAEQEGFAGIVYKGENELVEALRGLGIALAG